MRNGTSCKLGLATSVVLALAGSPFPLSAQTGPDTAGTAAADHRAALRDELFLALKQAQSEQEARFAEDQIWLFWMHGPDQQATEQINAVLAARRSYDTDKALKIADALVSRRPDYAEAWNQKATLLFMKDDLDGSLEAIARVLELEPKHFGALSGKAMILMRQGRSALAQDALREAVAIHPFLKERGMLIKPSGTPI